MMYLDDCMETMRGMDANSVHAIVTDPPAGISFMNAAWDHHKGGRAAWVAWMTEVMTEALRVCRPGAHMLCWALPRTSHWTATAIEDAGWEIRDIITHLFGSGFPKSLNVGKAIDGKDGRLGWTSPNAGKYGGAGNGTAMPGTKRQQNINIELESATARQWDGWGTALKPSSEMWILARKPLDKGQGVAANVQRWGCGALNIAASRIGVSGDDPNRRNNASIDRSVDGATFNLGKAERQPTLQAGRWPANVVLSCCGNEPHDAMCPVRLLDEQAGERKSGKIEPWHKANGIKGSSLSGSKDGSLNSQHGPSYGDTGGASRFFYVAKPSRAERERGLEGMAFGVKDTVYGDGLNSATKVRTDEQARAGVDRGQVRNIHPTVKATALMRHLLTLVVPPGGVVLDPFAGSGSTAVAAIELGMDWIAIEREPQYVEIARARILDAELRMEAYRVLPLFTWAEVPA